MDTLYSVLTLALWVAAAGVGAAAFSWVNGLHKSVPTLTLRIAFGLGAAMSLWTSTAYCLWLAGVPLKIGTIEDGAMPQNWWLPLVAIGLTFGMYRILKRGPL